MSNEIRALTGLRGVAAAYVCLYHLLFGRDYTGSLVQRGLSKGYLAVDVFFVLSGLVMALTYKSMFEQEYSVAGHANFLLRRAGRIMPLYLFVVAATMLLYVFGHHLFGAGTLAANILLLQSWGLHTESIIPPAWSISTEAAAYLLFPALLAMTVFSTRVGSWASLAVAIALVLLSTTLVTPPARAMMHGPLDVWDNATTGPLLRCLGGFLLGLLTYRAAESRRVRAVAGSDGFAVATLILLAGGIFLGVNDLLLYAFFPVLVLCLYLNQGRVAAIAGSPPLRWLGVLSFGIYLIHSPTIEFLWPASQAWLAGQSKVLAGAASVVLCVLATLLLAQISHVAIEVPGRALVRRIGWQPSRKVTESG